MTHKSLASLRLKKGEERRLKQGHLWVYSNEIDTEATPLSQFTAGQCVTVESAQRRPLGSAYINPHSLIAARLYSRRAQVMLEPEVVRRRLQQALALREHCYREPYYRLCFAESDLLPGVVVDRFDTVFAVQVTTAGMEAQRELLVNVLREMFNPRAIVLRNDTPLREMEGLSLYSEVVYGELPDRVVLHENGAEFTIAVLTGQKTGWYYDHRDNRQRLQILAKDRRVLDVFSYLGAWAIQSLRAGAREAHCVDSSASALNELAAAAQQNGVGDRCHVHAGDAFEVLQQLIDDKQQFDIVVVDPPAFAKRRKDVAQALQAYQRINQLALQLLVNNGILVSASCSHHVSAGDLLGVVRAAAKPLPLRVQIIAQAHQAADHPIHPAMPETEYLKGFFCRVIRE